MGAACLEVYYQEFEKEANLLVAPRPDSALEVAHFTCIEKHYPDRD